MFTIYDTGYKARYVWNIVTKCSIVFFTPKHVKEQICTVFC